MFWRSQMQQFLFNFLAVRIPPNSNDSYPQQQQQQFVEFFGVCLITILFDFFALRLYVVASLTSSLEKRTRRIDKKIFGFKMTRMVSDEKENFQDHNLLRPATAEDVTAILEEIKNAFGDKIKQFENEIQKINAFITS